MPRFTLVMFKKENGSYVRVGVAYSETEDEITEHFKEYLDKTEWSSATEALLMIDTEERRRRIGACRVSAEPKDLCVIWDDWTPHVEPTEA